MNKSIELSNLIKEENYNDDENTKLEIKQTDKIEEVEPKSLKIVFFWEYDFNICNTFINNRCLLRLCLK